MISECRPELLGGRAAEFAAEAAQECEYDSVLLPESLHWHQLALLCRRRDGLEQVARDDQGQDKEAGVSGVRSQTLTRRT